MPGFDGRQDLDGDEQDQSEVFDEENFEAADPGFDFGDMKTFEENPEVLDLTARLGDADDDEALIAEELDDDDIIELELEAEEVDDAALEGQADIEDSDQGVLDLEGEVEFLDAGGLNEVSVRALKENRYFESNRLDDDDIEDLGYGPTDGGGKAREGRA